MNREQVTGRVKEAVGKLQKKLRATTGSLRQQSKGVARELEGKLQKTAGDIKHKMIRHNPHR